METYCSVSDIPRDEMQKVLANLLNHWQASNSLLLPTRNKKSSVWQPDLRLYGYNGTQHKVETEETKRILVIMIETILEYLKESDTVLTLRALGYMVDSSYKCKYNGGREIDDDTLRPLVDDVCCLLRCTKLSLAINDGTTKCHVAGNFTIFQLSSNEKEPYVMDCTGSLQSLKVELGLCEAFYAPSDVLKKPRFILVIEKDSILDELVKNRFLREHPCIMMSSRGMPGFDARIFLSKLCVHFRDLPVFCLVDCDPGSVNTYRSYKYGNYSTAFASSNTTVQRLKYMGLSYRDAETDGVMIDMTDNDVVVAQRLQVEEWVKLEPVIKNNLDRHIIDRKKAFIESLNASNPLFLSSVWLPIKLKGSSACHDHGTLRMAGAGSSSGSTFDVKAIYDEEIVRIGNFSLSSSMEKLKEEVGKKLELDAGKIKMKYLDTSNEWIQLTAVSELVHAYYFVEPSGNRVVRLRINLKS